MLYWVRRWRLSDLNFFPSSRQTIWSAVIDFLTDMAGFGGSAGLSPCPLYTRVKAECTCPIRAGKSEDGTKLLLT